MDWHEIQHAAILPQHSASRHSDNQKSLFLCHISMFSTVMPMEFAR